MQLSICNTARWNIATVIEGFHVSHDFSLWTIRMYGALCSMGDEDRQSSVTHSRTVGRAGCRRSADPGAAVQG